MKRQIEIFTANCPVCDPVVKMVKELSCDSCEITTYNLVEQCEDKTCIDKVQEYGVK
ncbi:MAG TPA: glutaredoxin, partial [Zunongwangia profunda]|nr:glutaredoxin [Zunongwangia profunda]